MEVALHQLLERAAEGNPDLILVESDNGIDYKSAEPFYPVQCSCDAIGITILRVYGAPENCKHEVDHVGGVAKAALRRAIAADHIFQGVSDMVKYLEKEFGKKTEPRYFVEEIVKEEVLEARKKHRG